MAFKNFGFDLESLEDYMGNHLRLFISFTIGLLVFVGMIALSIFFIAVRGKEQVMVPDVTGKELTQALLELQTKELFPKIQLRTAEGGEERGLVLEQEPEAGTIVKAERRINLVISQGMALDKLGDYVGKNINDVRQEIQARNAQVENMVITLKEPFMYQYSGETAGIVLQQSPPPDSDITGHVTLELVVSRGQENARLTVPNFVGLPVQDALARLSQLKASFVFTMRTAAEGESPGTVFSQNPANGTEIYATDKITLNVTAPAPAPGETVGLFRFNLPSNPYPLPMLLEAELPNGTRQQLVSTNHSGGEIAVPYRLPNGSSIVLSMVNREIFRQPITAQTEPLSMDGL
ncbi:MAG: PASTA domain-containing protein [Spirochaetaceae bacterium]|jgi:beta-lactam-binding protein with PASTA domain|nr:PASTA domain-containing protein [Spirochaetaceae bacterium]